MRRFEKLLKAKEVPPSVASFFENFYSKLFRSSFFFFVVFTVCTFVSFFFLSLFFFCRVSVVFKCPVGHNLTEQTWFQLFVIRFCAILTRNSINSTVRETSDRKGTQVSWRELLESAHSVIVCTSTFRARAWVEHKA